MTGVLPHKIFTFQNTGKGILLSTADRVTDKPGGVGFATFCNFSLARAFQPDTLPGMRLVLVDGHYYAYRSFFAVASLSNAQGEPTNAVFGFAKMLRRLMVDLKPDRVIVVFDGGLPAERMELLPQYKQHRKEMPGDMRQQLPVIDSLVGFMGFQRLCIEGQEADDVMAAIATTAKASGDEIILATNDKDLMQLVDDRLRIYSPGKEGFELIDAKGVEVKWGVPPDKIGDILTLTGDASDNIPGVPGVGPKTAAKLIQQFGSVDALLEQIDKIDKPKLKTALEESRQRIADNKIMVRLNTKIDPGLDWRTCEVKPRYPELIEEVKRLGFKTMTREIEGEAGKISPPPGIQQGELF